MTEQPEYVYVRVPAPSSDEERREFYYHHDEGDITAAVRELVEAARAMLSEVEIPPRRSRYFAELDRALAKFREGGADD